MDLVNVKIFAINFVSILGNIISYAIFARIILSWLSFGRPTTSPGRITYFINDITDPFLNVAKKLPHNIGMIDLSPLIALLGINLFTYLVIELIRYL